MVAAIRAATVLVLITDIGELLSVGSRRRNRRPIARWTTAAGSGEPSPLEDKQPDKQDDHNHETGGVDVTHDGRLIAVCAPSIGTAMRP
jgi:hypothetical protein